MRRQRSRHRATNDARRVVSGIRRPANRPGRRATGSTTHRARGSAILTRRRRSWAASDGGHRRVRPPSARRGWTLRQSMNVVTFLPPAKATHLGGSRVSRPVRRRHRSKRQTRHDPFIAWAPGRAAGAISGGIVDDQREGPERSHGDGIAADLAPVYGRTVSDPRGGATSRSGPWRDRVRPPDAEARRGHEPAHWPHVSYTTLTL